MVLQEQKNVRKRSFFLRIVDEFSRNPYPKRPKRSFFSEELFLIWRCGSFWSVLIGSKSISSIISSDYGVRGLWTRWPLTIKERQNDKDKTKRNEQEWRQCVTTGLQSASYSCAAVQWEDLNWHIDSFKWTWISYFCHVDVETICVESMFRRCWRHDVVFARSEILPTVISWVR